MSGQSLVYGTTVLLLSSLFNRAVGFFYQIMMMRLLKPEGVGLFNMIFPFYVLVMVLATWGIPVAIAKLVAEEFAGNNLAGAYRIFKVSLFITAISGLFFSLVLLAGASLLVGSLFPNPDVYLCFISLVPGILVVSVCSVFRGFFQGLQRMSPTAVTQAVEQLIRVVSGLVIAWILLPRGIVYASVGISLGVVFGEIAGLIIMVYIYFTRKPKILDRCSKHMPMSSILSRIFSVGIPVTMTRIISAALLSVDALLIPRRLQASGMSLGDATASYGQFVGIAEALLFSPGMVTIALATTLIPAVSDALAKNKLQLLQFRIEEAVRITILIGTPVAAIFLVLPHDICQTLFGYPSAGDSLFIMAVSCPFLYLQQTTTGVLQGLGRAQDPFKNLVLASTVKMVGIFYLTSLPNWGIKGTAISMAAAHIIMSVLNYKDLLKAGSIKLSLLSGFYKPVIASLPMGLLMMELNSFGGFFHGVYGLGVTLLAGGLLYLVVLFLLGGITSTDVRLIKQAFNKNG